MGNSKFEREREREREGYLPRSETFFIQQSQNTGGGLMRERRRRRRRERNGNIEVGVLVTHMFNEFTDYGVVEVVDVFPLHILGGKY